MQSLEYTCGPPGKNIENVFENKENIVLETTGTYWPEWIFKFSDNVINYNIIMSWSVVGLCELIMRNKTTASNSISKFLNNNIITTKSLFYY